MCSNYRMPNNSVAAPAAPATPGFFDTITNAVKKVLPGNNKTPANEAVKTANNAANAANAAKNAAKNAVKAVNNANAAKSAAKSAANVAKNAANVAKNAANVATSVPATPVTNPFMPPSTTTGGMAPVNFSYGPRMQQPSEKIMQWATTAGVPTPTGPEMRNVAHGGKRRTHKKRHTKHRKSHKKHTRKHRTVKRKTQRNKRRN